MVTILVWLPGILLLNSCQVGGDIGAVPLNVSKQEATNTSDFSEVILFCGNPGVGKSSLCNSIFQRPIFQSGVSVGIGVTQQKQEYIHKNIKYIDTPGLADIQLRKQAAKEIEKSLKENNSYKIIFVATLEAGKIREADLVTINTVCEAIKAPFEYAIVFNKVTQRVIDKIGINGENLTSYLAPLIKQPASTMVITKDNDMEDAEDSYLSSSSKGRIKLMKFISDLKANMILDNQVQAIDVSIYEERVIEMENKLSKVLKQLAIQQQETAKLRRILEAKRQEEEKRQLEIQRKQAEEEKIKKEEENRRKAEECRRQQEANEKEKEQKRKAEIQKQEQETRTQQASFSYRLPRTQQVSFSHSPVCHHQYVQILGEYRCMYCLTKKAPQCGNVFWF